MVTATVQEWRTAATARPVERRKTKPNRIKLNQRRAVTGIT
jgi:hypothetical protein